MSHSIHFSVENHKLTLTDTDFRMIQENTDYRCAFALDSEWGARTSITARFRYPNGDFVDRTLNSGSCAVPRLTGTSVIFVGLYSRVSDSDIISTEPYLMRVEDSILTVDGAELSGSVNKSTAKVLSEATQTLASLESAVNQIRAGQTPAVTVVS